MSDTTSYPEKRMAENEMVFREINEDVQKGLDKLKKIAKEDDQEYLVHDTDTPMHYLCECADENCRKRIVVKPSEFARIHKNRKRFIVSREHEVPEIEKVVSRQPGYFVVEKYSSLPEKPQSLNSTDVDNS